MRQRVDTDMNVWRLRPHKGKGYIQQEERHTAMKLKHVQIHTFYTNTQTAHTTQG